MPSIKLPNAELHFRRYPLPGKPRLLLSHSLFFDLTMFEPLISELRNDFDVIAYDHRGQGESTGEGPLDMETLAEDAAMLIEALDLAPCYVAGNSMGGFVALRLAARHPRLLSGCVVMGSSAESELQLPAFEPLVESLAEQGTRPHIDALMHIMFADRTLADPLCAEMLAHWRAKMLALGPGIAEAARGVIYRRGMLEEISGLQTPLLVLAGEQDHAYSVDLSLQIVDACGHGEVRIIRGAGHSVALEAPQAVADALREFAGS